jgi:type II secretory pathway pseudopilin PulG
MSEWYLNYKKTPLNKISGFGLIESLITLALFAVVIAGIVMLYTSIQRKNEARELSAQTEAFAHIFAKYMHDNYDELSRRWQSAPLTLNPYVLGVDWSVDTAKQNFYRQTPCVTIVKNPNTGAEEALMYYVGGLNSVNQEVIRAAVTQLGRSGGLLLNGNLFGNSGWSAMSGSDFLNNAAKCGGSIANNSLAIKLDLLEIWNHSLQPGVAINRGLDIGVADKVQTLPGYMLNTNTAKSNIYFANGKEVILDNYRNRSLKLGIQYNGHGTGAATLGLGTNSASLIADTIQPNLLGRAGDPCIYQEIGKIIADRGQPSGDALAQVLSRNTLVCTRNQMLCAHANSICYLSSVANKITFRNQIHGIQNARGEFICPTSIPFLLSAEPGISNGGINRIGVYITKSYGFNELKPANIRCHPPRGMSGQPTSFFCFFPQSNILEPSIPDSIVDPVNPDTFVLLNRNIEPELGIVIPRSLNGFTTNVGYKINPLAPINLKSILISAFDQIGKPSNCSAIREVGNFIKNGVYYNYLHCISFQEPLKGMIIAVRSDDPSLHGIAIIKQATCSNSPIYVQN